MDKKTEKAAIGYTHHQVGKFTCESEVVQDGKLICCLHNPTETDITKAWKYVEKGKTD